MSESFAFDGLSWIFEFDGYGAEAESFVEDVHVLILHTLHASREYLNDEAAKKQVQIERSSEKATGEYADMLAQDHADAGIEVAQQERFLRNQALVSLLSRLTHALLKMARQADHWSNSRSQSSAGIEEGGSDEFKKIWREYRERFDINFSAKYIGFVDRYRRARNRIVHYGGEANSYLPFDEIDSGAGSEGRFLQEPIAVRAHKR